MANLTAAEYQEILASTPKVAMHDGDWYDGDPKAPRTPWGPAQTGYKIIPGVWWYSTAGHGGMMVSRPVAAKMLSGAARHEGEVWGGSYWYEEDVAYAVPFYEHPEWSDLLASKAGGSRPTKEQLEVTVRRWSPRYFDLLAANHQMPGVVRAGDRLQSVRPVKFADGFVLAPGESVRVAKVSRASIKFEREGVLYSISMSLYDNGSIVKV